MQVDCCTLAHDPLWLLPKIMVKDGYELGAIPTMHAVKGALSRVNQITNDLGEYKWLSTYSNLVGRHGRYRRKCLTNVCR